MQASMQILGIDFTSAPRRSKPITCAICRLSGDVLEVESLLAWDDFHGFEAVLSGAGEWVAAVDFPLGQPRRLVEALGWPAAWAGYVARVGSMTKEEFVDEITNYCAQRPKGDKHHLRETDRRCRSCSPMMLYGIPVGKMFYEGAPRVLNSGASVLPCRPNESTRIVVEAYPALLARRIVGKSSYKNDNKTKGELLAPVRREIVNGYEAVENPIGVQLVVPSAIRQSILDESSADKLDSILCALQLAAAARREPRRLGVPADADSLEGWIVDPEFTNRDDIDGSKLT